MALINSIIGFRSFEIVRDRIGEILKDELTNQAYISNDEYINANVFIERVVAFDHSELPVVNISLPRGSFDNQTAARTDGTYTYRIECYTNASSAEGKNGDNLSMIRLHRLMGICQSILEDSQYKTLGFAAPFVMNRHFEDMTIGDVESFDMQSVAKGVLTFSVRVPESVGLVTPVLLEQYKTELRLELTDKGYQYLKPVIL